MSRKLPALITVFLFVASASAALALAPGQLKACQARQVSIRNRYNRLSNLVTNMFDKFSAISDRVETYYTTVAVPAGRTVANYDALVADIGTQKSEVNKALFQADKIADEFNCTGTDPKGQLSEYRQNMQSTVKALKNFRTSVKNLIVAVRTAK